jgi:CO/xanthine dehydrogenase Mo-binding subunit
MEDMAPRDGRIAAANLGEYKEPSMRDMPPLTTVNVPDAGPGPFEAKAIGELPHIPTAGAIANAVSNAIGAPILDLPITAERVLAALDSKQASQPAPR